MARSYYLPTNKNSAISKNSVSWKDFMDFKYDIKTQLLLATYCTLHFLDRAFKKFHNDVFHKVDDNLNILLYFTFTLLNKSF